MSLDDWLWIIIKIAATAGFVSLIAILVMAVIDFGREANMRNQEIKELENSIETLRNKAFKDD